MATRWVNSVPAWTLGPRARNSKFGGGVILNGIPRVEDRLVATMKLSKKLKLRGDEELRSSGHVLHEIKTNIGRYKKYNASTAISYRRLVAGMRSGEYPKWVAMTAPQFGFPSAERGGMISRFPEDRQMAMDLHIEAITWSQELEQLGLGAGVSIWWPAFTARMIDNPEEMPRNFEEAWDMMLKFWVKVLGQTGGTMWCEWKPGDPGIDYLCTIELAIKFCQAVNEELGRIAMLVNNEFAHILLSGIRVVDGVRKTVQAGLFSRFFHANSGQMFPLSIQKLLDQGADPEYILIGIDWDWYLGAGGIEMWKDQQEAIGIMDEAGEDIIYCEHDVNPAGLPPLEVFKWSIQAQQKMLANVRAA